MGTFAAGFMLDPATGRPVAGQVVRVVRFADDVPLTTVVTGALGGYGRFEVEGEDGVSLVAGSSRVDLVSMEQQLAGLDLTDLENRVADLEADSGTSGTDIQVGGTQPASGWWLDTGQMPPDTTAPTAPTGLSATATGSSTVNLSWTASTDNVAVTGYEYRVDSGAAVDAGAGTTETVSGLEAEQTYSFQVRAYDGAGNRSAWSSAANATTLAGPDVTPPTGGTLSVTGTGAAGSTRTLTVTGASDAGSGLHATPYAFSIDAGGTWTSYQASASYETAPLAEDTYKPRARVRDAAENVATISAPDFAIDPAPPILHDEFSRVVAVGLGDADSGQTWDTTGAWSVNGAEAVVTSASASALVDVGSHDIEAEAELSVYGTGTASAGIYLNYTDDDNFDFLRIVITGGSPELSLQVRRGGSSSFLAVGATPASTGTIRVTCTLAAGQFTYDAWFDDVKIGTSKNAASIAGTRVGIGTGGGSAGERRFARIHADTL